MLYARKSETPEIRYQTLLQHGERVAEIMGKMITALPLGSLCRLCALGHDMGKAGPLWQADLEHGVHGRPHAYVFPLWLARRYGQGDPLTVLTAQMAAWAGQCHHGGLRDHAGREGSYFAQNFIIPKGFDEKQYTDCLDAYFADCISEQELETLFDKAREEVGDLKAVFQERLGNLDGTEEQEDALWFLLGMTQRLVWSALIDADRFDAASFENGNLPEGPDVPQWKEWNRRLEEYLAAMKQEGETASTIFTLRSQISQMCRQAADWSGPGIYRLFVPTGGGKTLSAMRYATALRARLGGGHILYVAPFLTIIEQNADDCRQALGLDRDNDTLIEHHSNVVVDEQKEGEDENQPDCQSRANRLSERWDAPIVFTTMVQFLNTLFSSDTQAARRMQALANSVIIIDEAQNLPVKTLYLFNMAMNFLSIACGTTVVLCTATQPSLQALRYPLLMAPSPDLVPGAEKLHTAFRRVQVVDLTKPKKNAQEAADLAREQAAAAGSVLVVVNTKGDARRIYQALHGEEGLYHLSTNLCAAHRTRKIREMKEKLARGGQVICVSTQLIEAGVNISFGCVIRALSGIESLAQAAGRCNRHGERKGLAAVYLIDLKDEGRLNGLPDIQTGQDCSRILLNKLRKKKDGRDIIAPDMVERYYTDYFSRRKEKMGYPYNGTDRALDVSGMTLFDLLSRNRKLLANLYDPLKGADRMRLYQMDRMACSSFSVIEQDTIGVIVPYEEGEKIILDLNGDGDIWEKKKLLRRAQRYTLNLYRNQIQQLAEAGAIYPLGDLGVYALEKAYYHDDVGASDTPDREIELEDNFW